MDTTNNRRPPTQGGEPGIETADWRSQLPPDARERIVNKIMETLKMLIPISGQNGMNGLRKFALGFEEKIFAAAGCRSDYLTKICSRVETKSQNSRPNSSTSSFDIGDWQEEIYQKIKAMKELHYLELEEMYQKSILPKLHQLYALPQPPKPELLNKLKEFKSILEGLLGFLQVSKNDIGIGLKDKIGHYEKQIVSILSSNNRVKPLHSNISTPLPSNSNMLQHQQSQLHEQGKQHKPTVAISSLTNAETQPPSVFGKSSVVTEQQPIERVMKAAKSMPPGALSAASVSGIGSVAASMMDRVAGSAPGNYGSRAAVGEDLVAMTSDLESTATTSSAKRPRVELDSQSSCSNSGTNKRNKPTTSYPDYSMSWF